MTEPCCPYSLQNHTRCIDEALAHAKTACKTAGTKLTSIREDVLTLIWQSHQPIGAYELLAQLKEKLGKLVQPPTVYRALDFLLEHDLIHRITSLNAFIGCNQLHEAHQSCFLICTQCRTAIELDSATITQALSNTAAQHGFAIKHSAIELSGLCKHCQGAAHE